MIDLWHDRGIAHIDLRYIRTQDGRETDFLITRDGMPWCLFEAKLKDGAVARHHIRRARVLGSVPVVQLAQEGNIKRRPIPGVFRVFASRFF